MVSILVCRDKKVDVTIMRMVLFIVEETKPVVSIAQNFILKIRHPSLTDEKWHGGTFIRVQKGRTTRICNVSFARKGSPKKKELLIIIYAVQFSLLFFCSLVACIASLPLCIPSFSSSWSTDRIFTWFSQGQLVGLPIAVTPGFPRTAGTHALHISEGDNTQASHHCCDSCDLNTKVPNDEVWRRAHLFMTRPIRCSFSQFFACTHWSQYSTTTTKYGCYLTGVNAALS